MTVTCNFQGRLGNLLYEIANTLATGWRSGAAINFSTEHEGYYNDFAFYRDYVKHIIKDYPLIEKVPPEFYEINENVRLQPKKYILAEDAVFKGYWTSPIYFSDYRERINEIFTRKDKAVVDDLVNMYRSKTEKKIVGVHVRRTDYATEYGWALGLDYYGRAFQHIQQTLGDVQYLIFSDDPKWAMENLYFMQSRLPARHPDYIEMQLMGRFDGLIIANSTFSAWGAMLANQKLVVSPAIWRDTKGGHDPYNEWIYENHWVRV